MQCGGLTTCIGLKIGRNGIGLAGLVVVVVVVGIELGTGRVEQLLLLLLLVIEVGIAF